MQFYGAIDLLKNELRNAVIQNLGTAPSTPSPGQLYYDTAGSTLYWWDGTTWQAAKGGAAVSYGTVVTEQTFGASSANGVATTVSRSDHAHGNPVHNAAAHSAIPMNSLATPIATWSNGGWGITSVLDPTNPQDAATKNYVDNTTQGLDAKQSVRAATTANIANFGTAAPNALDGVTLAVNDRVLVKDQTTQAQNGIYAIAVLGTGANGTWNRATDMDTWAEVPSAYTWVEQGTTNADSGWVCTADQGGTLGTTAITWTQFNGAGAITAGAGLTKTGSTIDFVAGDTSLTVAADSVVVNTAVIATVASVNAKASKYAAALNGTASPETVTHNLNTRDIELRVLNGASPYTAVEVDWDATTLTTATVRYNPNLGSGYRVVVFG